MLLHKLTQKVIKAWKNWKEDNLVPLSRFGRRVGEDPGNEVGEKKEESCML